jgi:hypothetical protein
VVGELALELRRRLHFVDDHDRAAHALVLDERRRFHGPRRPRVAGAADRRHAAGRLARRQRARDRMTVPRTRRAIGGAEVTARHLLRERDPHVLAGVQPLDGRGVGTRHHPRRIGDDHRFDQRVQDHFEPWERGEAGTAGAHPRISVARC